MSVAKINLEQLPKIEVKLLCEAFLDAIKEHHASPENRKAFEAWQQAQRKEASRNAGESGANLLFSAK